MTYFGDSRVTKRSFELLINAQIIDKMASVIPIVDLEQFNICKEPEDVGDDVQRQLAAQIIDAFSTVGFVGLKNYGIPQDKVKQTTA